jgi:hypothetical protein
MAERQYLAREEPTPIPKKLLLKARIDRIVALSHSLDELRLNAELAGIEVRFRRDGGKTVGVSFAADGVSLRGREAGCSLPQLQSLYEHTPTPNNRGDACLAERTGRPDRRESHGRPPAGDAMPDKGPGGHPLHPAEPGRPERDRIGWPEAAFRALAPGDSLLDLIIGLGACLARVCRQNDYRRFHRRPEITPL